MTPCLDHINEIRIEAQEHNAHYIRTIFLGERIYMTAMAEYRSMAWEQRPADFDEHGNVKLWGCALVMSKNIGPNDVQPSHLHPWEHRAPGVGAAIWIFNGGKFEQLSVSEAKATLRKYLQRELDKAVEVEAYERAAKLRDAIKSASE